MKPSRLLKATLLAISSLLCVAVMVFWTQLEWRTYVVAQKMQGTLADATWDEIGRLVASRNVGLDLEVLSLTGNLNLAIGNPHGSDTDIQVGRHAYDVRCASCHSAAGPGVDLVQSSFTHGESDWALFRSISNGIPNTAMGPIRMSARETWQVIAYVKTARQRFRDSGNRSTGVDHEAPTAGAGYDRLHDAQREPHNWLTYSGTYDGRRHSRLQQINRSNVDRMTVDWIYQISTPETKVETTPLVVDGVMYLTEPPNNVIALDSETGRTFWTYRRTLPDGVRVCCGMVNRGVALLDDMLFLGTLDTYLVALNARTGKIVWETKVAEFKDGYSITGAPLALEDKVITGIAGGDLETRGFLAAFDSKTGKELWRFHTIPAPGEPHSDTWSGESWRTGGGATWLTGSFDPGLNLLYWGVGNPWPDFDGDVRKGDNLYSNSVIALDPDTGRLKWFFQFTPHDEHDWDSVHIPVLADGDVRGRSRRLLLWANRSAFYYLLDRETGEYLSARAFSDQTWAERIDASGRPVLRPEAIPRREGVRVSPGATGATNWWSPSYSPMTGLVYIPVSGSQDVFFAGDMGPGHNSPAWAAIRALEFATGDLKWEFKPPGAFRNLGGLLSTSSNLVFGGIGRTFFALDAENGKVLWQFNLGGDIIAAPITFASAGKQRVTVAAGRSVFTFSLTE